VVALIAFIFFGTGNTTSYANETRDCDSHIEIVEMLQGWEPEQLHELLTFFEQWDTEDLLSIISITRDWEPELIREMEQSIEQLPYQEDPLPGREASFGWTMDQLLDYANSSVEEYCSKIDVSLPHIGRDEYGELFIAVPISPMRMAGFESNPPLMFFCMICNPIPEEEYHAPNEFTECSCEDHWFHDLPFIEFEHMTQITDGPYFYLFEQAKEDTILLLKNLINIDVSDLLEDLLLFEECESADFLGAYLGGNRISISVGKHLCDVHAKVTLMHEILHYLLARINHGVEGNLFICEEGKGMNSLFNEGLVTMLSEFFYGVSNTNVYGTGLHAINILLIIYGEDLLLDAFSGRSSVIKHDMITLLGNDRYNVFSALSDHYVYDFMQTGVPREISSKFFGFLQEFVFLKGYYFIVEPSMAFCFYSEYFEYNFCEYCSEYTFCDTCFAIVN